MNKTLNKIKGGLMVFGALVISGLLTSCHDEPEPPRTTESTILIYAVATNSLTGNLVSDKNEMLRAAENINLKDNNVILFETQYKTLEDNSRVADVNLLKLKKNGENYIWENIGSYNDGVPSLNPQRVTEIINHVTLKYPASTYGLVFWSHSTGSQPYFEAGYEGYNASSDTSRGNISVPVSPEGWFGQDMAQSNGDPYYMLNIHELADAVPDNLFEYIWFDSCYMSNIESIYQFRNKCKTFVGYATEVLDAGLPYHYVLPYMVGENPDLEMAANIFYNYYANSIATIGVTDMSQIEELADFCRLFYNKGLVPSTAGIMKYSRSTSGPFYDLGDYTKAMALAGEQEITLEEWNSVIDGCVKYKAATNYDFSGSRIYPERYSGISTHIYSFEDQDSDSEKYYKSLDWYKRVFN